MVCGPCYVPYALRPRVCRDAAHAGKGAAVASPPSAFAVRGATSRKRSPRCTRRPPSLSLPSPPHCAGTGRRGSPAMTHHQLGLSCARGHSWGWAASAPLPVARSACQGKLAGWGWRCLPALAALSALLTNALTLTFGLFLPFPYLFVNACCVAGGRAWAVPSGLCVRAVVPRACVRRDCR